jgi:hypothetical protein
MEQHHDESRGFQPKLEANENVQNRRLDRRVSRYRQIKRKYRSFQSRTFAAMGKFGKGDFRRHSFTEPEFEQMGFYISPSTLSVDPWLQLLKDSVDKDKVKLEQMPSLASENGIVVDYLELFEKEKAECLENLSRLAAAIEQLRDRRAGE